MVFPVSSVDLIGTHGSRPLVIIDHMAFLGRQQHALGANLGAARSSGGFANELVSIKSS